MTKTNNKPKSGKQLREEFRLKCMDIKAFFEINGKMIRFDTLMEDFDKAISDAKQEVVKEIIADFMLSKNRDAKVQEYGVKYLKEKLK